MCTADGADPGDGFPGDGVGCCAAPGAGFRGVAQALRSATGITCGQADQYGQPRVDSYTTAGAPERLRLSKVG